MAYVPPHRRVREGSSSSSTENVQFKFWDWFAVYGSDDTSNFSLEIKPFDGETYEHLRHRKLYTLSANPRVNGNNRNPYLVLHLSVFFLWFKTSKLIPLLMFNQFFKFSLRNRSYIPAMPCLNSQIINFRVFSVDVNL